jgi:hypothetical protein
MRVRVGRLSLWRWWWQLGGAAVVAYIALGLAISWSPALWASAGIAAVVYVGVPVAATSLIDLVDSRKTPDGTIMPNPESNRSPLAVDQKEQSQPHEYLLGSGPHSKEGIRKGDGRPSQPPIPSPSSEFLQRRIFAADSRSILLPDRPIARPWRRVGSAQFASLVQALAVALPSVDDADDVAGLAGVRRYLIRRGRDTPKQRWQAVLEQAINDAADDFVCGEALKLNDPQELRAAVADWLGVFDE